MNNKIMGLLIIMIVSIGVIMFYTVYSISQDQSNIIIDETSIIIKKDSITNSKIKHLENVVKDLKINDSLLKQKLLENNNRFESIIFTLKKLDHEKKINDNKIRNYSYNDNWNWFENRFSKQNNRISINADTIVRQPSKNGQLKGD